LIRLLLRGQRWQDAVLQVADEVLTQDEARQIVEAHEHHLNKLDDLIRMFLDGHEAEAHLLTELLEPLVLDASKDFNHFTSQLERCLLKLNAFAWRVGEKEAEVNVHDVAFDVDQDVPIVTVLDLENVADQGVSCERPTEVILCL